MNSSLLDISAMIGLAATAVLTINLLLGMMVSTNYRKSRYWKKLPLFFRQLNILIIHNWTAYVALLLAVVHPVLLLFDRSTKFKFIDIVFPIYAPHQRLFVAMGTISLFAIILVIITTQKVVKKKLGFRTWKNIHLFSYGTALLFIVHGLVMDPQLKDRPVDLVDAEKIVSEACFLILVGATVARVNYQRRTNASEKKFYPLRISRVSEETNDAKSFRLDIPVKYRKLYRYSPGQFIILALEINGIKLKRSYSFSSSPHTDELPQITVKRIPGGVASGYLTGHLKQGDTLFVFPPSGVFFTEPEIELSKHYFFFAGGSGITPIFSIIKTLLKKYPGTTLHLVYANRVESSIIFYKELHALQQSYADRFSIVHILSQALGGWSGMKGRIDKDNMKLFMEQKQTLPIVETEYYICGPSPFMELVEQELLHQQIPVNKIHMERFISIGEAGQELIMGDAVQDLGTTPKMADVLLDGMHNTVECAAGENILDALLNAGINAPYSCKEGVCSTCKAKLIAGRVKMQQHASLTDIDILKKHILTCQAIPLSQEIKIDYDTSS